MAGASRLILLAPGAGAPSSSTWMQEQKQRLEVLGDVETFDYPYMLEGRKSPDRAPVLIAAHEAALERACRGRTEKRVLAGKSMGGRIGCHVAVKLADKPAALVCLGYPLVGQRGDVRDAVLLELETPVLFVQGSRDPLCPLDRLETARKRMRAPNVLYVVEGGNHSLGVGKRELTARSLTQGAVDAAVTQAIAEFLAEHA